MNRATERPDARGQRDRRKVSDDRQREFELAHSTVVLEYGPVGVIARVDRGETTDYAGPLPTSTIDAMAEIAGEGR